MARNERSTNLYPHPFSKAYWRDAAAELKSTKMLVITALMIALRIALKPFAIYIGPQMAIQTATLATALGAMIFGPVVAIPAALISDTIGFMIFPTGDYFLPFALTEIASTMIYALCLYRAKPNATRVIIARFLICFAINVVLQQFIFAWQYTYMGNPEKAKDSIMGIMTAARLFKNLFFFPIESIVITLFLKVLIPITSRARLTYGGNKGLDFTKKQIIALVVLLVIGVLRTIMVKGYKRGIWFSGPGTVLVVMSIFFLAGYNGTSYYPSTADLQSSLTLQNSSSSEFTLTCMSIVSLIIPFVVAYIAYFWRRMDICSITTEELKETETY